MSAVDSRVGEAVEVIAGGGVRTQGPWTLIPARVGESVVVARGAIHCVLGLFVVGTGRCLKSLQLEASRSADRSRTRSKYPGEEPELARSS